MAHLDAGESAEACGGGGSGGGVGALYARVIDDVLRRLVASPAGVGPEAARALEQRWLAALESLGPVEELEPPLPAPSRGPSSWLAADECGQVDAHAPPLAPVRCLASGRAFFGLDGRKVENHALALFADGDAGAMDSARPAEAGRPDESSHMGVNADTLTYLRGLQVPGVRLQTFADPDLAMVGRKPRRKRRRTGQAFRLGSDVPGAFGGSVRAEDSDDSDYGGAEQERRAEARRAAQHSAQLPPNDMEDDPEVLHTTTPFAVDDAAMAAADSSFAEGWSTKLKSDHEGWRARGFGVIARAGGREFFLPTCSFTLRWAP